MWLVVVALMLLFGYWAVGFVRVLCAVFCLITLMDVFPYVSRGSDGPLGNHGVPLSPGWMIACRERNAIAFDGGTCK